MVHSAPLVSVIVPCYQHRLFVERCLESIVTQTYRRIELILVDDNSLDESFATAAAYLKNVCTRFERVVTLRNSTNRGAHFSLNRGLRHAQGDYISFMNSDDEYCPERLQVLASAMSDNDGELAFSLISVVDDQSCDVPSHPLSFQAKSFPLLARERFPSLSWGFVNFQLAFSTGNIVLTSALARRVGPFLDLKYCHDWDYIMRCTFYAEPTLVAMPLYKYRLHGKNSFRALRDVAQSETARVLEDHFRRVMLSVPPNKQAAAPQHWPTMFRGLLEDAGVAHFYDAVYEPYKAYHRTIQLPDGYYRTR